MKKSTIALLPLLSVLSFAASAQNGTIDFVGNILGSTCNVSPTTTVMLGDTDISAFPAAGGPASSSKKFEIAFEECPTSVRSIHIKFDGTGTAAKPDVFALNPGQSAKNVGVALYQGDEKTQIPVGGSYTYKLPPVSQINSASIPFVAKYYAVASGVAAGTANATSSIAITYN